MPSRYLLGSVSKEQNAIISVLKWYLLGQIKLEAKAQWSSLGGFIQIYQRACTTFLQSSPPVPIRELKQRRRRQGRQHRGRRLSTKN